MVLDIITTATLTTATMARDLLRLSLLLMLTSRLKLTPGTDTMDTDMVLDTMVDTMVDTRATPTWCIATTVLVVTTAATMVATLTTTTARDLLMLSPLLMPRLILGMDTTDFHTTDMATATTGASKKDTSNPELTRMKCQHFDDDLPNVLNFREESKRTKENILLLQTHCI